MGLFVGLRLYPDLVHAKQTSWMPVSSMTPHSLISYVKLPHPSFGKARLGGAGDGGTSCPGSTVCVRLYTITVFKLGFCLCKVYAPSDWLQLEPLNHYNHQLCYLSLVTDRTLSGPAYLFIVLLLHATVQWRACLFLGQDLTQALLVVSASLYEVKK